MRLIVQLKDNIPDEDYYKLAEQIAKQSNLVVDVTITADECIDKDDINDDHN